MIKCQNSSQFVSYTGKKVMLCEVIYSYHSCMIHQWLPMITNDLGQWSLTGVKDAGGTTGVVKCYVH